MDEIVEFPESFLWGSAVSGHQIEGGNRHSDWWHWELATSTQPNSGAAVDHWNRFEEDYDLLEKMGHQAFRIGIEWARIEPQKGVFDPATAAHYRKMLESLRRRGIKICLTLHHWVLPQWVARQNDWLNPDTVTHFLRYVEFVLNEFGEFPDLWITLNEPMVALLAENISGDFPPQRRSIPAFRKAARNMLRAHAGAYSLIHQYDPSARVGLAMNYPCFQAWGSPGWGGWYERRMETFSRKLLYQAWDASVHTGHLHWIFGKGEIEGLRDSIDFCGINYYFRLSLRFCRRCWRTGFLDLNAVPPGVQTTDLNWQIWPKGLAQVINDVWNQYGKPIYITENGLADQEDRLRADYIIQHLTQLHCALKKGIPVEGYFHWSFIDNFEWKEGFKPRFGLVAVDYDDSTLPRTLRPSAKLYSQIIRNNGIPLNKLSEE
jgi:beta-glucosidase